MARRGHISRLAILVFPLLVLAGLALAVSIVNHYLEVSDAAVVRKLKSSLESDGSRVVKLEPAGWNHYAGTLETSDGYVASLRADVRGGRLEYEFQSQSRTPEHRFSGTGSMPAPSLVERFPWLLLIVYGLGFAVGMLGATWGILGLLKLRPRSRWEHEKAKWVGVCLAANLSFAALEAYAFCQWYVGKSP